MDAREQRREIAAILAAGYWRLLRSRAAKPQNNCHLEARDSRESRCYVPPPE
jgi:hypothetical protein